jgi:hypothetical protein
MSTDWRAELVASVEAIRIPDDARKVLSTIATYTLEAADHATRKNLESTRRLVEAAVLKRMLPAVAFETAITELQSAWSQSMELVLPYAPAEVQEQVGELYRTLFDGIREDLAK